MARLVGINHVALEVGDVDDALAWYGRFFEFELRGRGPRVAFIDIAGMLQDAGPGSYPPRCEAHTPGATRCTIKGVLHAE